MCAKPSEPGRARARLRAGDEDQPQTPRAGRGAGTCPCRARPSSALLSSRRPGREAHAAAAATCSPASRCGLPGAAGKLTRPTGSPAGLGVPSARTQGRQWLETLLRGPRPCWTDPCPFYPATRGLENADEAAPDNRGLFPCALRSGPLCAEAPTPTWRRCGEDAEAAVPTPRAELRGSRYAAHTNGQSQCHRGTNEP